MSENLYTVSKLLPDFHKESGNALELLKTVKDSVRLVKSENPELVDCNLCDVGFIQQSNGLEIKLYFAIEG